MRNAFINKSGKDTIRQSKACLDISEIGVTESRFRASTPETNIDLAEQKSQNRMES